MKRTLFRSLALFLFLHTCSKCDSQNLLANGSFEDLNTCYEFQANCSPSAWFIVTPSNGKNPNAVDGVRTLRFIYDNTNSPSNRTFPYSKILCPLESNIKFKLSLWVNPGIYDFTHFDILLTKGDPSRLRTVNGKFDLSIQMDVSNIEKKGENGWLFLSKEFTVENERNFILLGDLSNSEIYSTKVRKTAQKANGDIPYWIDDIRLTSLDSSKNKCIQFEDVKKMLYEEVRRHTPNVYLDEEKSPSEILVGEELSTPASDTIRAVTNELKSDTLVLSDLLFKRKSSIIKAEFRKILDSGVLKIRKIDLVQIIINGYTDNDGTEAFNLDLSRRRAQSVMNYVAANLPEMGEIISSKGFGMSNPIARNISAANKAKNRRVELVLIYKNKL